MVQLHVDRCEVLWKITLVHLHNTVSLPFEHLEGPIIDPYTSDWFSILPLGFKLDTYLLMDCHDSTEHILYYGQLIDPEFDLLHHLFTEKVNTFDTHL